jgi:hypothetical protein
MPMYKKTEKMGHRGSTFISVLRLGVPKMCFYWGVPNVFPKNIGDRSINMAPSINK